ncbi:MAG: ketoacyl-ACP synthase III [Anaerolineales bacterium]
MSKAVKAQIIGWGAYVPRRVLTNADLAQMVDTSDEWIVERTGIRERRLAAPDETTASMATIAAERALASAGADPLAVDLVIVATATPDYLFPATACLVQRGIGAKSAAAFDLGAGCSGFIYGLAMGAHAIESGACRYVLVVGAETLSRITNWQDRGTCVLFGDGAGAVLLGQAHNPGGILATHLGADGAGADWLILPAGGSRKPASAQTVAENLHTIQMDGQKVFRFATKIIPDATRKVLEQAGLSVADVDMVIAHQANARILQAASERLGVPHEKMYANIDRYGNTSAASIPIALCEAAEEGRLQAGQRVVLVGFGAGLTWGAVLVEWGEKIPQKRGLPWLLAALRRWWAWLLRRFRR